jgi:2,3-diketo-5-methylthio-1-phosphopentane phosphatase
MYKLNFFVDFDGTISNEDLGDKVFKVLGKFEPYHSQLINKEINIKEYWHKLCDNLNDGVGLDDIQNIAKQTDYDYYFKDFYDWVKLQNYEIRIVSDGFDIYIDQALKILEINDIEVFSNKFFLQSGSIKPYFYGEQENCFCLCASCKRNVVLNNSEDDDILVYIGDGYSDFCPAEHCDIVFAKKNLAAYCNEKRIPHFPYKNFFDIKKIITDLIIKKKIKKRNFASIKRKNAFESE